MSCKLDWNGISKWIDVTMSDICTMSGETLSRFEDLSRFNLHKPLTTKVYSAAVSWKVVPASVSHFTATVILSMVRIRGIQRHSAPSCSKSLGSLFQTLIHFELYNTIYTSCTWHVESIRMVWSFGNNPPKTRVQVSRFSRPKRAPVSTKLASSLVLQEEEVNFPCAVQNGCLCRMWSSTALQCCLWVYVLYVLHVSRVCRGDWCESCRLASWVLRVPSDKQIWSMDSTKCSCVTAFWVHGRYCCMGYA